MEIINLISLRSTSKGNNRWNLKKSRYHTFKKIVNT